MLFPLYDRNPHARLPIVTILLIVANVFCFWMSVQSGPERFVRTVYERGFVPQRLTRLVQGDLDWIVMKCQEKQRDRRYETANGLALELERYLHDEPVLAGPPSSAYRLRKFLRRHTGLVTAVAAIALAIVLGANDVVNPAARDDKSSPIYGMPILDVDKARTVIVIKRSLSPGFAGIPNELFALPNTLMLYGDGKAAVRGLIAALKE